MEGRGIDSELERILLEYRPKLEYTKPTILGEDDYVSTDISLHTAIVMTPDRAVNRLNTISNGYKELVSTVEQHLSSKPVTIDKEARPEVSEAIKALCPMNRDGVVYNDDTITFDLYKKCVELNDPQAQLIVTTYEKHGSSPYGSVDVELYRVLKANSEYWGDFYNFTSRLFENTSEEYNKKIEQWQELDREAATISREYPNNMPPDLEARVDSLSEEISKIKSNTDISISVALNHVAATGERALLNSDRLVHMTTNDWLNSMICCLIKKSINAALGVHEIIPKIQSNDIIHQVSVRTNKVKRLGDTEADLAVAKIKIKNYVSELRAITSLLKISIMDAGYVIPGILSQLLQLLQGPLSATQNAILSCYREAMNEIVQPALNWLDSISSDPDTECIPVEVIGDTLMDAAMGVSHKFEQAVVDIFKFSKLLETLNARINSSLTNKQRQRAFHEVIEKIADYLEKAASFIEDFPIEEGIDEVAAQLIRQHGWDLTYNSMSRNVQQILNINCGGA